MRISSRRVLASWVVGATLIATGCGSDATESTADPVVDSVTEEAVVADSTATPDEAAAPVEMTKVRLGVVGASMQVTFAPYTSVPINQGYFAEEGIELEIQNLAGSAEVVQAVAAGQLDVGVILSPPLYSAVNIGADVQGFYNLITTNFAVPHVPVDSEIETILDLEGTTVGAVSLGAGAIPLIKAMVASEGGDPESIDFVAVGAGADVATVIESGDIDVVGLWDAVYARLAGLGIELRPVSNDFFNELGFQGPIFARSSALADDPDLYERFGRAVAKASVFTKANPSAAVLAHWAEFPDTKPTGVDDDKALADTLAGIEARLSSSAAVDGRWGYASPEEINEFAEVLVAGGGLEETPDPAMVYTDALIDGINDFDPAPIEAAAQNYGDE